MKYPLLFLFLIASLPSFTQEEITTHQQEIAFFEKEATVSAYDFVFQNYEETKELWKVDLMGILLRPPSIAYGFVYFDNSIRLDYEKKIGKAFSLNSNLGFSYSFHRFFENGGENIFGAGIGIQPRWYHGMKKRITSGDQANNLSGNYIGLGIDHHETRRAGIKRLGITEIGLKYGIQRRIFGRGFIDFQIGPQLRIRNIELSEEQPTGFEVQNKFWAFTSQVKIGFTLGSPDFSMDADKKCDVFQCFEEQKSMFKLDLLNIFNLGSFNSVYTSGQINFAHEFKIAPSFSIQNGLSIYYFFAESIEDTVTGSFSPNYALSFSVETEGRYYYDLQKRIASGKSANNLSGNYFALELSISPLLLIQPSAKEYSFKDYQKLYIAPKWGIQRTIFKRGYIDYALGVNLWSGNLKSGVENADFSLLNSSIGFHLGLYSQLQVGLRF